MPFSLLLDDVIVAYKEAIGVEDNQWLEQEIDVIVERCHEGSGNGIAAVITFFNNASSSIRHEQEISDTEVVRKFFDDVHRMLAGREGFNQDHFSKLSQREQESKKSPAVVLSDLLWILSDAQKKAKYKTIFDKLVDVECQQLIIKYRSFCIYREDILEAFKQDNYCYIFMLEQIINGSAIFFASFLNHDKQTGFVESIKYLDRSTKNIYDFFLRYYSVIKPLIDGEDGAHILRTLTYFIEELEDKIGDRVVIIDERRESLKLHKTGQFQDFMHHLRLAYLAKCLEPFMNNEQLQLLMSLFCYLKNVDGSSSNVAIVKQLMTTLLQQPYLSVAALLKMPGFDEKTIAENQGIMVKMHNCWSGSPQSSMGSLFGILGTVTHESRLVKCLELYRECKSRGKLSEQDVVERRSEFYGIVTEIFADALEVYHITDLKKLLPQLDVDQTASLTLE